jgi:hypothetical protein
VSDGTRARDRLDHNRKGPTPFDFDAAVRLVGDVADELPPSSPLSSQALS